ncbi:hypothetical protein PVK06_038637 [Gossypium arboreum]|uniref:Uncharacterized protein n=1 Tax=Gossypium arboreum TaxID=29729 RepID=A0ABR0N0N6_GOSAR|nr:hypothetical protein PVK06_038637 [Gossypium arboreum]
MQIKLVILRGHCNAERGGFYLQMCSTSNLLSCLSPHTPKHVLVQSLMFSNVTGIGSKLDVFQRYWNVNNVEALIMDRKYASRLLYYKTKSDSSIFCNSVAELLNEDAIKNTAGM